MLPWFDFKLNADLCYTYSQNDLLLEKMLRFASVAIGTETINFYGISTNAFLILKYTKRTQLHKLQ